MLMQPVNLRPCSCVVCQAIDDQVELLAANAAKALGSLWGGLNTVAKAGWTAGATITSKVEAATLELAKELVDSIEGTVGASHPAAAAAGKVSNCGGFCVSSKVVFGLCYSAYIDLVCCALAVSRQQVLTCYWWLLVCCWRHSCLAA